MAVDQQTRRGWFPGHSETDVDAAVAAAEAFVWARCDEPDSGDEIPADLLRAIRLQAARLLARQHSPEGVLGADDLGVVRISSTDRDVERLIAPHRKVVLG